MISDRTLAALSAEGHPVTYPTGTVIMRPGARFRPAMVAAGRLRVFVQAGDGRQATLHYVGSGEPVGLTHHLAPELPAFVQVITEATLLHFESSRVDELMLEDAALAAAIARLLAQQMVSTYQHLRQYVFGSARHRLARNLLTLAEPDHAGRLAAQISQQQLADAVGSVREHVARLLREMRSARVVATTRTGIVILDEGRLRAMATVE